MKMKKDKGEEEGICVSMKMRMNENEEPATEG